ncbi:MAG: hydrolase [Candidatus Woykebacteria bacterium GWB1_45_5]|uniref:Hydrolase n=2 Tax=Candidatus Woykeibacteriota TaxID=1817899 RepID=A0A1G1W1N0_9BACT|nr:MAG: hydrolase [Candidatus Woykebacteria bacterium GWA1_44_8]OGY22328.1 MAG: hydrolase [Candidatus Woykebacteria bacterium GWB1_45_5]
MMKSIQRAGFRESNYNTGEVTLHYAVGPANGWPLVLIPAQAMPWESYQRVLPELSKHFRVFAIDVRGHGKSSWTPGAYTFNNIGQDLKTFLKEVVSEPAIISGNSSGGLVAVWLAVYAPELVRAIVPEDPPLFSAEWPRFRDDCYAYHLFKLAAETLGTDKKRNLAQFFARLEIPIEGRKRPTKIPTPLFKIISGLIYIYILIFPNRPIDLPFLPLETRVMIKGLSMYDPDFSRACVDGSMFTGFDHAAALAKIKCPTLLLQANWFRHEKYGLVGAMDDQDVAKVRSLVKDFHYVQVDTGHVIHLEEPEIFIKEIIRFSSTLPQVT